MRAKTRFHQPLFVVAALGLAALLGPTVVLADPVGSATARAYGVQLSGPVPLGPLPEVESSLGDELVQDSLLEVPADPLATSFTAHVEADTRASDEIEARLQETISGAASSAPEAWSARGFAITEDLDAAAGQVTADVIESESTAACVDGEVVFGSAARIANLSVGGQAIPVLNPEPNQVVLDQGGIRVVLWETNWDPATLGTTDGEPVVFTNALHVTLPLGVDLVVSHSEATVTCAGPGPQPQPPGPQPAPPAQPVPGQPAFTG